MAERLSMPLQLQLAQGSSSLEGATSAISHSFWGYQCKSGSGSQISLMAGTSGYSRVGLREDPWKELEWLGKKSYCLSNCKALQVSHTSLSKLKNCLHFKYIFLKFNQICSFKSHSEYPPFASNAFYSKRAPPHTHKLAEIVFACLFCFCSCCV